jgi:hypothetical protein
MVGRVFAIYKRSHVLQCIGNGSGTQSASTAIINVSGVCQCVACIGEHTKIDAESKNLRVIREPSGSRILMHVV